MNIVEIIILSLALGTDAMLVSFSYGTLLTKNRISNSLKLSFSFGLFQFLMPIAGRNIGGLFYKQLFPYSKIVVFIIFTCLGIKFIKNALANKENNIQKCISIVCLLTLSLATSIDAFGAGVTLKFVKVEYINVAAVIGIITAIMSMAGYWSASIICSRKLCNIDAKQNIEESALKSESYSDETAAQCRSGLSISRVIEIIGGIVLIYLGIKNLI